MKFSLIFILVIVDLMMICVEASKQPAALSSQEETEQLEWMRFKQTYGKQYQSGEEETKRLGIFLENLKKISSHNQMYRNGLKTFQLGVNKFADWTSMEFRSAFAASQSHQPQPQPDDFNGEILDESTLVVDDDPMIPDELDWTREGRVTPVQDQTIGNSHHCSASYAFAAIATVEGQLARNNGRLRKLSEQQLVDCSKHQGGNNGCKFGLPQYAYEYIIDNHGQVDTADSYPYVGYDQQCKLLSNGSSIKGIIKTNMKSYKHLPSGDEQALKQSVAIIGPISIQIDLGNLNDNNEFMLYKSGVYDNDYCQTFFFDHSMTIVGYGTNANGTNGSNGTLDYWKIKNSFGTDWGMDGYILMSRNKRNQCEIASKAYYIQ